MTRETIEFGYLQTISWHEGRIIDWATGGQFYSLNGEKDKLGEYHIAFSFDSVITSPCGQYAFLYKRLGTKGLLFKNGDILREINRSYYRAENYEYPADKFPKLIDIQTGEIIDAEEDISSGFQRSAIIGNASTNTELWPRVSFDRQSGKLAILVNPGRIEVLSAE